MLPAIEDRAASIAVQAMSLLRLRGVREDTFDTFQLVFSQPPLYLCAREPNDPPVELTIGWFGSYITAILNTPATVAYVTKLDKSWLDQLDMIETFLTQLTILDQLATL